MLQVETADNAINMIPVQRQSISEIIMEVQEATDDDGRSYVCNYVSIELCARVCVCVGAGTSHRSCHKATCCGCHLPRGLPSEKKGEKNLVGNSWAGSLLNYIIVYILVTASDHMR